MGAGQSAGAFGATPSGQGASSRSSRVAGLAVSGRYFTVTVPGGAVVHVLGVCPASSLSEEEAYDLVIAAQPSHVYVDVPTEWTSALLADVRAGRVGDWRIPDTTPPFRYVSSAGILGSVLLRNAFADNEMFGLIGAETYGPFKAALAAGEAIAGRAAASNGDGGTAPPPKYVSFPYAMAYNGGAMLDRPAHLSTFLLGDNAFVSTTIYAIVGNSVAVMAGEPGAAEFTVSLPEDTGYLTRDQVGKIRRDFRAAVNAAVARVGAETLLDVEADLSRREAAARDAGDAAGAAVFESSTFKSQAQVRCERRSMPLSKWDCTAFGPLRSLLDPAASTCPAFFDS